MNLKLTTSFPQDFWVYQRSSSSNRLQQIKSLEQTSIQERLLAAILKSDRLSAIEILSATKRQDDSKPAPESNEVWIDAFQRNIASENLTALIYERIWELDINQLLEDRHAPGYDNVLAILNQEAKFISTNFPGLNERFLKLVTLLGDWVVWIKGSVLSRSLYERPQFRLVRDFDFIVQPGAEEIVAKRLASIGFSPVWNVPGICCQFGVGPVGSLQDLAIKPSKQYAAGQSVSFKQDGWPILEMKFDPLDTGLAMKELQRFFADCQHISWMGHSFLAPSNIDHLMLELTHLHKHGFEGWHWLYDIHLLLVSLSKSESNWQELIRRCRLEGVSRSAWAGLCLAADRLESPVPRRVLEELQPDGCQLLNRMFAYTVTTEFLWNTASLPELLLNTYFTGDQERKLKVLADTALPSCDFLSGYYLKGAPLKPGSWQYLFVVIIHLLTLLLPGGLIRRTFGQFIWTYKPDKELGGSGQNPAA